LLEDKSLTTWENAVFSKELVKPQPGSHWLLVTSAFHMPRAVGVFRKVDWPGIIPYPTDYRAPDPAFGKSWRILGTDNLQLLELSVKEYFG
ncbi:YdcF family protein, partial [Acinetobacter baumannii]